MTYRHIGAVCHFCYYMQKNQVIININYYNKLKNYYNKLKKMKKNIKIVRVLSLSLAMAIGILLPTAVQAQSDVFFHGTGIEYTDRDMKEINLNITNADFGEEVPLGSGLLIMVAAGVCYFELKKKECKR